MQFYEWCKNNPIMKKLFISFFLSVLFLSVYSQKDSIKVSANEKPITIEIKNPEKKWFEYPIVSTLSGALIGGLIGFLSSFLLARYNIKKAMIKDLKDGILSGSNTITYNPQDDKLDIAAWIPFNDEFSCKLICFAQCKTGTHWARAINDLDVGDFLKKWFSTLPKLNPVRTFMIADVLDPRDFYHKSGQNLFFDRIRLTAFLILNDENDWYDNLRDWTREVMVQFNLSFRAA